MREILLFDMDNVLLFPIGYRRALQRAVQLLSAALGYRSPDFSDEAIEAIEASGVTSEWEMAAITAATLMAATPTQSKRLPESLTTDRDDSELAEPPVVMATFHRLAEMDPTRSPLDRAEEVLLDDPAIDNQDLISEIRRTLRRARTTDSVIYRTIQELVLGSQAYESAYNQPSFLKSDSYLDRYDQTSLDPKLAECLASWRQQDGRELVIFTNRPSTPPPGHVDTPEAEIGARLVGLEGAPIIGSGDLGWLALEVGERIDAFLKPSPIHALSALLLAVGAEKAGAMQAAHSLVAGEPVDPTHWQALDDSHVVAFEDSAKGLRSAARAKAVLAEHGVDVELDLIGISQHPAKQRELEAVQSVVYPEVNAAVRATVPECSS